MKPRANSSPSLGKAAFLAASLLTLGCKGKPAGGTPAVGGLGVRLAAGVASDLRVTPDGQFAAYLLEAEKPRLEGVPAQMVIGELHVVPTTGGSSRKLGNGVTNVPGGYLFSADSRWVLFLAGYNAASQSGDLYACELSDPSAKPEKLGANVSYMVTSPDSRSVALVEDGALKLGPIDGQRKVVAGEVSVASFSPDNKRLFFKRRLSAAGGLWHLALTGEAEPRKLADQVGDYEISPDGKYVAMTQRSEVVRSTYDLLHASAPEWKAVKLAGGVGGLAFSPDGKWLARTQGGRPETIGDLHLGPSSGGEGRKIAERVNEFSFAPDSSAIAYLEHYDIAARAGLVGVATLPDGKPKRIGERSPNYAWGADGRHLAFLSRFVKPLYSVDLMLYPIGAEEAFKVQPGVFGYGFSPKNEFLFFRSNCIRNGRACDLLQLQLSEPKQPPRKAVEGVYSWKVAEGGERVLVTYARVESETFDTAVLNLKSGERRTLEQFIALPALMLDGAGSRVAYVVNDHRRPGVYVASQVP